PFPRLCTASAAGRFRAMKLILIAGLGGAFGAAGRYALTSLLLRVMGPNFPWGTLAVNVLGSLAMGFALGYFQYRIEAFSPELRLFLTVGVLGGFTTFSAFSLDVVSLIQRQDLWGAALYVGISVVLSVIALAAGLFAARAGLA
ncbi:MAG: fluoride efflux transporter CrcB, partial [Alphaproteobacteria bacterium]